MAFSGPAPVLYLRSFRDDANTARTLLQPQGMLLPSFATQEEQISMVMHPIGPLLAIGRPGERLPELGASRLYVRDEVWQETIEHLMRRARLVVLYAGDTEGFWWEVHRAVRLLRPEQLVFLILYNAAHYAQFRQRAEAVLPCQLPAYQGRRFAGNVLQGLIYVTSDWVAHFIPLKHHWWRGYFLRPLASSLHMALRPVFTQLHVPWQKPPIQWKLARALVGMLVLTWLYAKILLALLR
jgi:hypothetical protein